MKIAIHLFLNTDILGVRLTTRETLSWRVPARASATARDSSSRLIDVYLNK